MTHSWLEADTHAMIESKLAQVAPDNIAPIPIASAKERQPDGSYLWNVDLHVKIRGVTEYDVQGTGPTLAAALRSAYLGLNNEQQPWRKRRNDPLDRPGFTA